MQHVYMPYKLLSHSINNMDGQVGKMIIVSGC